MIFFSRVSFIFFAEKNHPSTLKWKKSAKEFSKKSKNFSLHSLYNIEFFPPFHIWPQPPQATFTRHIIIIWLGHSVWNEGVVLKLRSWCRMIDNLEVTGAKMLKFFFAKVNMSKHVASCEPQKKLFFWIKIFFWRIKKNASYHHIEHSFPQLLRKKKKKFH